MKARSRFRRSTVLVITVALVGSLVPGIAALTGGSAQATPPPVTPPLSYHDTVMADQPIVSCIAAKAVSMAVGLGAGSIVGSAAAEFFGPGVVASMAEGAGMNVGMTFTEQVRTGHFDVGELARAGVEGAAVGLVFHGVSEAVSGRAGSAGNPEEPRAGPAEESGSRVSSDSEGSKSSNVGDSQPATESSATMGGGAGDVARVHNPKGMTQIGRDVDTVNASQWAPNKAPGVNSVAVHGTPEGWAPPVETSDVSGAIRSHPDFVEGQPTCLWSCHAGSNGTGQALANELNGPVIAPNGKVTVFHPDEGLDPIARGGWSIFWPGGR